MAEQGQPEQLRKATKGGIDLANPILATLRQFGQEMAVDGVACILIGMNKTGGISTKIVVPGGIVPILGMMELAKEIIMDNLKQQQSRQS